MQKMTQVPDFEYVSNPTADPLAGSGFEQEQPDPDFTNQTEDEEAEAN